MDTISITEAADLFAVIPYHLGFRPQRSVVVMCFHGTLLGLVMRLDAQPPKDASKAALVAMEAVRREAPTWVCIVGFEDEHGQSASLSRAMRDELRAEGIAVRHRYVVRDGRWWGADCSPSCCPRHGTALTPDVDVPAVANYVARGRVALADRSAVERLTEPMAEIDPRHDDRFEAIAHWRRDYVDVMDDLRAGRRDGWDGWADSDDWVDLDDLDDSDDVDDADDAGEDRWGARAIEAEAEEMVNDALLLWVDLLAGPLGNDELGVPALVGLIADKPFRDALITLLTGVNDPMPVLEDRIVQTLQSHLGDLEAELDRDGDADLFVPLNSGMVLDRLSWLCRQTPAPLAAPVLSLTAAVAWHHGDGAVALICVGRALQIDPEHTLCRLLATLINHGVRPPMAA